MYYKLRVAAFSILFVMILICCINNNLSFALLDDFQLSDRQSHLDEHDTHSNDKVEMAEAVDEELIKCSQMADKITDMLIAIRNVIAKNQELINRDPVTGNYSFKGLVPAQIGSQVANDFSLVTGYRLKQTSLKVRNPSNAPDEWEKKVLELLGSSEHPENVGFGEVLKKKGKRIYRYMKPIYVEAACLQCHTEKAKIPPAIRQYLEMKYPFDQAFGYKEGELRGGISIIIPLERLVFK